MTGITHPHPHDNGVAIQIPVTPIKDDNKYAKTILPPSSVNPATIHVFTSPDPRITF